MKTLTSTLTLVLGLFLLGAGPAGAQSVTFDVDDASVSAGNTVTVPVTVEGFTNVTSAQFTLEWDSSILSFNSLGDFDAVPGVSTGTFGDPTETGNAGVLTFAWEDPAAQGVTVSDGTTLFTITLNASSDAANQNTDISFTGSPTPMEVTVDFSVATFQDDAGTINVTPSGPGNTPPSITNPGDQSNTEGDAVSLQIQASDPDTGDNLSYTATGLPGGLSIDPNSGVISGTVADGAAANSPYSAEVTVSDDASPPASASTTFTWTISAGGPTGTVTFNAGSASVPAGGQVTVPVTVEGFTDVTGAQFTLEWDASVLSFNSVGDFGVDGVSGGVIGDPTETGDAGTLTFAWDDPSGTGETVSDGTTLFTVTLDATGSAGESSTMAFTNSPTPQQVSSGATELTFDAVGPGDTAADVSFTDSPTSQMVFVDFAEATFTAEDGTVDILSQVPISGAVTYYDGLPLEGSTLTLSGDESATATTSGDGSYSLMATVGSTLQLSASMSNDPPVAGAVNVNDLSLTRRHILNVAPLDAPVKLIAADVDGSDAVNVNDLSLMRQYILGIKDSFARGLWDCIVKGSATAAPLGYDTAYSYSPLSSAQPGQDFFCFRTGDVDGSWSPNSGTALAASNSASSMRLSLESRAMEDGNEVLVFVRAGQFDDIGGYQFTMEWDAEALEFAGVERFGLKDLSAKNFGTHRTDEGLLSTVWTAPSGKGRSLDEGETLFVLRFRPVGDAISTIDVSSAMTPAVAHRGDASLTPMSVAGASTTVEGRKLLPDRFTLTGNYPNPFSQSTQIGFDLPQTAPVTVEVYDLLGRQVLRVPKQKMTAGANRTVQLDASSLSPGSYFYRVRADLPSGTTTKTGRMTLVK